MTDLSNECSLIIYYDGCVLHCDNILQVREAKRYGMNSCHQYSNSFHSSWDYLLCRNFDYYLSTSYLRVMCL